MRGFYEESPEVKARRDLHAAAKRYVSKSLVSLNTDGEQLALESAAIAYAETLRPKRAKKGARTT